MTVLERDSSGAADVIAQTAERLTQWAVRHAFPLWADRGVDHATGAFHEKIALDGTPVDLNRRARVQPRQVFAFSHAASFGWDGPAARVMRDGTASMFARYQRPDRLFRTVVGADGSVIDDRAVLYDQAFVLLAMASLHDVLDDATAHRRAVEIRDAIVRVLGHPAGGFASGDAAPLPLLANPHMHMLEACLDWSERGGDAGWGAMADVIAELALDRMIDPRTGALHEAFDAVWGRAEGVAGQIVEPGHQFEWAWLLMRWGQARERRDALAAALRLIAIAERFGVDQARNAAVLELLDDMTVHTPVARLWAQTERVKARCLAATITGDESHLAGAQAGCESLLGYLDGVRPGLWRDQMDADGRFVEEPAPASSFYHIVVAIEAMRRFVRSRSARS